MRHLIPTIQEPFLIENIHASFVGVGRKSKYLKVITKIHHNSPPESWFEVVYDDKAVLVTKNFNKAVEDFNNWY